MSVMPSRPHTSNMTSWSRHDPICMPVGNTDKWSKLRVRTNTYNANNSFDGVSVRPAGDTDPVTSWQNPQARFRVSADGRVQRVSDQDFGKILSSEMRGKLPGDLNKSLPSASLRRSWMNNQYHQRAKDGFRYWPIEKNPTQFGKYGMGSFKTVLGIGNAPRT